MSEHEAFVTKHRPTTFADVVGHDEAVRALEATIQKKRAHSFLFTGPSGCGKTTMARLTAAALGCERSNRRDIDAATHTGIDDVRRITEELQYRPFGGEVKAIVMDEVHALTPNAVKALLISVEEPPKWAYWMLCTTELPRVPKMMRTRCFHVDLKPVKQQVLARWLGGIAKKEGLKWKGTDAVLDIVAEAAEGSPRQALSCLAKVAEAKGPKEAGRLLQVVDAVKGEAVDLARLLLQGARWREVQGCLRKLDAADPESVRRVVRAYMGKVVRNTPKEAAAGRCLEIIDAFNVIFYDAAALDLACGTVVLSGK